MCLNPFHCQRIPLTVVKNCRWQNALKETKVYFVCLATADSISISALPNKCYRFYHEKEKIKATQTKPEVTQNCSKVQ